MLQKTDNLSRTISLDLLNCSALIILLVLGLIFLIESVKPETSFALFQDNEIGFGPIIASISNSLVNLSWPLRMDTFLGGVPLYNFTHLSPLYPGYFFYLPIFNTPLQIISSVHFIILFHFLVLLVNTFLFLRVLKVSRFSAIVGALSFTFCANTLAYSGWVNVIATYSWLPLYLAGLVGVLGSPSSKRFVIYMLVGIIFLTAASPSQSLIHATYISIVFVVFYLFDLKKNNGLKLSIRPLAIIALIGLIAILICAPALLPALIEYKDMIRWIGPFPPVIGNAPIPFEAFLIDQMEWHDLPNILVKIKGRDVGDAFCGPLLFTLATFALLIKNKPWTVKAIIFICIYSLFSSFGSNMGFAYINHVIPYLNKIREPSRFLILFQLGICTLAAVGIDAIVRLCNCSDKRGLYKISLCMLITIILSGLATYTHRALITSSINPWISIVVLFFLSASTLIIANNGSKKYLKIIPIIWGCSVVVILFFQVPRAAPNIADGIILSPEVVRLNKVLDKILVLDPKHEYRVIFEGGISNQKAAMVASYKGIRTFNSYLSPLPYKNFLELYYHAVRPDNYFRVLGGRYLICEKCTEEITKNYELVEVISGYSIYEAHDVLPRLYFSDRINGNFLSLGDFQSKIAQFDLSQKPLFVKEGATIQLPLKDKLSRSNCILSNIFRDPIKIVVDAQCENEGILVFNEFYDSAWNAQVNKNNIDTNIINGNQIGIKLAPGLSKITLSYSPINFKISLFLFVIGLFLLIFLFFSNILKYNRKK